MAAPFEVWFHSVPSITRSYIVGIALTTLACHLKLVSPWDLYLNYKLVARGEVWRLVTNFLYYGPLGIDLFFHMFFLARYSSMLEQEHFRNRPADFVYMLILGMAMLLSVSPFVDAVFLGSSLSFMLVYVWAKNNPESQFSFLGLLNFRAPMLPWVLCGFAYLMNNQIPVADLLGIGAGHIYYYLSDTIPKLRAAPGGPPRPVLHTPALLKWLLNPPNLDEPLPDQAPTSPPGGYAWAAGQAGGAGVEDETVPAHPSREASPDAAGSAGSAGGAGSAAAADNGATDERPKSD